MNEKEDKLDISTIIVTYNSAEVILSCLKALSSTRDCRFEILIVDNASQDSTVSLAKEHCPEAHLIENKENKGFGAANNQALPLCRGDYILFLNPDTIVQPDSLIHMMTYMKSHPDIGLAGAKMLYPDGTLQESISYRFPGQKYNPGRFSNPNRDICWVLGACMMGKSDLIRKLNGFDEFFFLYGEDQDICFRTKELGYKIGYCESAIVTHIGGESERNSDAKEVWSKKTFAEYKFYSKYFSEEQIHHILLLDFLKAKWRILTLKFLPQMNRQKSLNKLIKYQAILESISVIKKQMNLKS